MAASLITKLPKEERQQLLDDLNDLNMAEIKSFCQRLSIPYRITIETEDGSTRTTCEEDRKEWCRVDFRFWAYLTYALKGSSPLM